MKKWIAGILGTAGIITMLFGIDLHTKKASAITIIGGADGPASVFLAGELGSGFSVIGIGAGIILLAVAFIIYAKSRR